MTLRCGPLTAVLALLAAAAPARDLPVPRDGAPSGAVISRISGERVRFVAEPEFRGLVAGQDLLGGDVLRTGPEGLVSILFVDRTVMRIHRNSELTVNEIAPGRAVLTLERGAIWARTPRGARGTELRTPTAAASVRGTDWAVEVAPDGATRLSVLDGSVALSNEFGAVTARAGEQALAAPGKAPELVRVANLRDRAQMLYTLSPLEVADPLADAAEWLARPGADPAALARYNAALTDLRAGRAADAAVGFSDAARRLDPERRAAALWLAAFARLESGELFDPPAPSDAAASRVAEALTAALAGDLDAAASGLSASSAPAALSAAVQVAILQDDLETGRALLSRLRAAAPGSLDALEAEAIWLMEVEFDHRAAAARLEEALRLDPSRAELWSRLGQARDALNDPVGAEAAMRRAIEAAPAASGPRANLAILLMDQERIPEAEVLARDLLADNPGGYLGLRALGRAQMHRDQPQAERTLLSALAAQPAAAETSLMLALAAWQEGDLVRAEQELDAAGRLDPNDPLAPEIRSVIALDRFRADEAIVQAREALRLRRQQGGRTGQLAADRRSGSRLAEAFSFIGLDAWARDVADAAHDPLSAESLFAEGLAERLSVGRDTLSASGSDAALIQGLQLDPLAASSRIARTDLLRRPFVDAELSGTLALGDVEGAGAGMRVEGFSRAPGPLALSAEAEGLNLDGPAEGRSHPRSASVLLGARPGPRLNAFAHAAYSADSPRDDGDLAGLPASDAEDRETVAAGIGGSVLLSGRSHIAAYASYTRQEIDTRSLRLVPFPLPLLLDADVQQEAEALFAGLAWRAEDAAGAWWAGVEGQHAASRSRGLLTATDLVTGGSVTAATREDEDATLGRLFLDRRQRLSPKVELQGGVALGLREGQGAGDALAPRAGVSWTPLPGLRLRAAALRDQAPEAQTLAPATILGLVPLRAGFGPGGELAGAILRADMDLGSRLHLSAEHQALRLESLSYATGDALSLFDVPQARLLAFELRADLWVGGGFGASASLAYADTRIEEGANRGRPLPDVPDWTARAGLTWTHPAQIRATLEAVWTSARWSGLPGLSLDPVATVDAAVTWQPFDRRVAFSAELRNLLDADLERPFGQPSLGRSAWLTAAIRF